ncbi:MAG: hypothetical protein ACREBT_03950 [Thermoplasmata archaeon]
MSASESVGLGSLDELKRVKDAETEWDARLKDAAAHSEAEIKKAHEEADGRVGLARTAAHQSREERVRAAQAEGDQEAERILSVGDLEAVVVLQGQGKQPRDLERPILEAILGEFLSDGPA